MSKLDTTEWNSAEYLGTAKACKAYLAAAFEEGDPALISHALGNVARAKGMMQLARDTGLTREGLYKALSPTGNPSFATVLKVAQALGYKLKLAA